MQDILYVLFLSSFAIQDNKVTELRPKMIYVVEFTQVFDTLDKYRRHDYVTVLVGGKRRLHNIQICPPQ